ncbi:WD40-repeat-containing domain protein [Fimicolochytrium jonesii]|uniref:WD40-repeat-containing domain protein n=1 Tax=Fimicolochytrium jonesii TaxID=1396493 RepID=UPI0022FEA954|nr:WD40-repeat-containing domain protein [Fimicolochytrium jonesii]KAI8820088.1 WD40-repeat-containing domain protein [Fimicolochytrium jonesii]
MFPSANQEQASGGADVPSCEQQKQLALTNSFLLDLKARKEKLLAEITAQLSTINEGLASLAEHGGGVVAPKAAPDTDHVDFSDSLGDGSQATSVTSKNDSSQGIEQKLPASGTDFVQDHLEDLQEVYLQSRSIDDSFRSISDFSDTLSRLSKYSRLKPVASLDYAHGLYTGKASIICSIDFDKDDEFFATAGVLKKIKIFDFANVLHDYVKNSTLVADEEIASAKTSSSPLSANRKRKRSQMASESEEADSQGDMVPRFPVIEIDCPSKVSCLAWDPEEKSRLASADYEGVLRLWDSSNGQLVQSHEEHENRIWSLDWCPSEKSRFASASDDAKGKIWTVNQKDAVATVSSVANLCSVRWNPTVPHHVAFGSADHHIHYYDIRNLHHPLHIFRGHRRAVSYVRFKDHDTLISCSTDCTMRMWKLSESFQTGESQCVRTFSGHLNEKNFVGMSLDCNGEFLACGSETNDVVVYWWQLPKPFIVTRMASMPNWLTGKRARQDDSDHFISSLSWQRTAPGRLIAANSQGKVTVMEMV